MLGFKLVPANINLQFIPKKKVFFVFSALLVLVSVGLFTIKGLNYGIDFKGGIMIEVRTPEAAPIGDMRSRPSRSPWPRSRRPSALRSNTGAPNSSGLRSPKSCFWTG
jgi:preprotein translocase subunit SecF